MNHLIRTYFSKIKFRLSLQPEIEKTSYTTSFIPPDKHCVLLISADFELAWAWRYSKSTNNPLQKSLQKATLERNNLPKILKLCDKYNIPITWATVGHLFLDSCIKQNGVAHNDIPHPSHFENNYWKFNGEDWYEHDPCSNLQTDPEWYCPDLIRMILDSKVKHEIGCHTFSHIDCSDEICPPELLRSELRKCKELASAINLDLKSFVHPGHTIGNLDVLAEEGFTNFRTDYRNVLGYPKKHTNGLWELKQTAEFALRKGWSLDYHIYRYKEIIRRAIKSSSVCVFWFHPSFDETFVHYIWPEIFEFINENRDDIWVTTHTEYINWLESINK